MFANFDVTDYIAIFCSQIDKECRQELQNGIIISERDYVSVLSTRIRDRFRHNFPCHAQTLRQGMEIENGVDGLIIFKYQEEVKVGWYEAKWPRVGQMDYPWDRVDIPRQISHFSEQILKQHHWNDSIALWEMFFNEQHEGYECPPFDCFGSSCVWHSNAYDFIRTEGLIFERWRTEKLKELLENSGIGFYSIIFDILSCRKGKKFKIDIAQNSIRVKSPINSMDSIEIPLPLEFGRDVDSEDDRISAFMKERNIAGYLMLDITKEKEFIP